MNRCCHRRAVCVEGSCGASKYYEGGWHPTWPPPVLQAIKDLLEAPPVLDPVQDLSEAPGRVLQPAALRRVTDGCPICISLRLCVVPYALHGRTPNHVRHQPASKDTPVQLPCTWFDLQSCLALHLSPHLCSQHGSLTIVLHLSPHLCSQNGSLTIVLHLSPHLCSQHGSLTIVLHLSPHLCSQHGSLTIVLHLSPHLFSQHGSLTTVHYLQECMPEHAEVEPWVLNPKVRTMRCSGSGQSSRRTRSTPLPACNMLPSIARSIHVSAPYTLVTSVTAVLFHEASPAA